MNPRTLTPDDLAGRFDPFTAVVDSVPDDSWTRQTPCTDWRAGDLVDHVVDTQRNFLVRHGVLPDDHEPVDAHEEDTSATGDADDPQTNWRAHADRVRSALTAEELNREIDGYFGPTTVGATMIDFYGFDLIVHRWDLARACGRDEVFTPDELDAVERSIATFGDQMYSPGICQAAVDVPADADRQTRLLGVMGRAV